MQKHKRWLVGQANNIFKKVFILVYVLCLTGRSSKYLQIEHGRKFVRSDLVSVLLLLIRRATKIDEIFISISIAKVKRIETIK